MKRKILIHIHYFRFFKRVMTLVPPGKIGDVQSSEEWAYLSLGSRQQTILFLEDFIHAVKELPVSPGNPGNRDGSVQSWNISPLFIFNYTMRLQKEFPCRQNRRVLVPDLMHRIQYHTLKPHLEVKVIHAIIRWAELHWTFLWQASGKCVFWLTCNYLNIDKCKSGNKLSNCQIYAETESAVDIQLDEHILACRFYLQTMPRV